MAKKPEPLPPGTTRAPGVDGEILFDGQFVTIKHYWKAKGGRGETRYPLAAVTGVEFKPGAVTAVFTLVVAGGVQRGDARRARQGDPLSVQGGRQSRSGFEEMRDRILRAVAERDRGAVAPAPDLGDQLARLARLHESGALTAEEFAAAKNQLLGMPQDRPPGAW